MQIGPFQNNAYQLIVIVDVLMRFHHFYVADGKVELLLHMLLY